MENKFESIIRGKELKESIYSKNRTYADYPEVNFKFADAFIDGKEESMIEEISHSLMYGSEFIQDLLFEYVKAYKQNLSREELLSNILINAYELEDEKEIRPKLYEYYSQFVV